MEEYSFVKCNGTNPDFIENCRLLDEDLDRRVGKVIQREKYAQYNQVNHISEAIVVYQEGELVGGGAIRKYNDDKVELKRVYVHSKAQGKGIGTQLVKQLIHWGQELGYKSMLLETGELLKEAEHVYRKLGFHVISNYEPYTNMQESLCMEKNLGEESENVRNENN